MSESIEKLLRSATLKIGNFPPIVIWCSFVLIQKNQKIKAALQCASAANDTKRGADEALAGLLVIVEISKRSEFYLIANVNR